MATTSEFSVIRNIKLPYDYNARLTFRETSFHRQELGWMIHCFSTLHQLYLLHCEAASSRAGRYHSWMSFRTLAREISGFRVAPGLDPVCRIDELLGWSTERWGQMQTRTRTSLSQFDSFLVRSPVAQPSQYLYSPSWLMTWVATKMIVLELPTITTKHGAADNVNRGLPKFLTIP